MRGEDDEQAHEEVRLAAHVYVLGAQQRAEEVGSELRVPGGRVAEGRKDVSVGRRGEVEVPLGHRDDLACSWVEGFDTAGGWVRMDVVDLVAYSHNCEFDVGLAHRRRRRSSVFAAARRLGVRRRRFAEHDVR